MEPARIGPLRVHCRGGADRRGGGEGPAIVLCHGFGAPGHDLVDLARAVDAGREVRWFFPEAPLELDVGFGMTGRAWWEIDPMRLQRMLERGGAQALAEETPAGMAEARAALEETLTALGRERGVQRSTTLLGGFSQGAMISTEIGLHADAPFAGLVLMSGTLLSADRWRAAAARTAPRLSVLLSHGRADPLLPFSGAEALRALLEGAGATVEWVPHAGQHEIPPVVLSRLGAFARDRLSAG